MNINYPAEYEIGDIVFTCIGAALFGQISAASNCWSNHVGIIIGHNGEDFLVAESRVPLSTITTLSRFIKRSSNQRYAIKRLGNDSNLLIVFYVQIMPDDFVMQ
ncbi:YiiX/YebB-like N1pC/P60 family cysteine hydrolase, partial [Escherichia coli]